MHRLLRLLTVYRFVFKLANKGQYRIVIAYLALTVFEALVPIAQVYLLKRLTDTIVTALRDGHALHSAAFILAAQLLLFVAGYMMTDQKSLIRSRLSHHYNYSIDYEVIRHLNRLPLLYFEKTENHNVIERVSGGVGGKALLGFTSAVDCVKQAIVLIGYTCLLYRLHWSLAFLLALLLVPSLYSNVGFSGMQYHQSFAQTQVMRKVYYLQSLFSSRNAQKELKVFDHGGYLIKLWKRYFWQTAKEQLALEKKGVRRKRYAAIWNQLINACFMFGLIWFGRSHGMTVGDYVAYSQLLAMGIGTIQALSGGLGTLVGQGLYLTDLRTFLTHEAGEGSGAPFDAERSTEQSMDQPSMEAGSGPDAGCRIELRDVSFRYPNSGESALKHISFTIEPGETVAIVGDNGSGKSTLAKCVMGLYPADRGSIRLDGVDIQTIPIPELRKRMTVLFQDFVRYELSVRENVTLSGPDQSPEKAPAQENEQELNRLHAALAQADLQETIQRLPGREHTALGPALDHGIELSGGQWQKLALARALYKEAGMIILDEPTAAIDPIAEAELLSRFMQICADKTAVIITHRLACCVQADKIVVLQQGELAEIGTHAELMRLGGIYSRMFQSQAASYMHHVNVQSEAS